MAGSGFLKTRSLAAAARPHMRALMEDGGETVNLAVEDRGEAVYLAQVECRQMMHAFARPAGLFNAAACAALRPPCYIQGAK